jgi:hypothetical protein
MFHVKAIRCAAAARVLACVLAGALLLFEVLAANGEFHRSFHNEGKAASNACLLCLFAKGQVDSCDIGPILAAPVRISLTRVLLTEPALFVDFSYLSSPSRAPPAFSALLSVVG